MTIIGIIDKNNWEMPRTYPGLIAVVIGLPKVGDEVLADKGKTIIDISKLLELRKKRIHKRDTSNRVQGYTI